MVKVTYDKNIISLKFLVESFFMMIDPLSLNKQGEDVGVQYRTGIYFLNNEDVIINEVIKKEQEKYNKKIKVEVSLLKNYYTAEEYHQKYLEKNINGYCHIDLELYQKAKKLKDPYIKS